MMALDRHPSPYEANDRRPIAVSVPAPNEGLHRALKESFGEVQPISDSLTQLLAQLR